MLWKSSLLLFSQYRGNLEGTTDRGYTLCRRGLVRDRWYPRAQTEVLGLFVYLVNGRFRDMPVPFLPRELIQRECVPLRKYGTARAIEVGWWRGSALNPLVQLAAPDGWP